MNQLSLLLLVDPDPKGLETLTYGFEREGCTVAGTSDPHMAPELARTTVPQLAVISLRQPEQPALALITGLRQRPDTRDLPVVTLGPAALRPAAMAAGANDYLTTPLFVRDVISVGRLVLLIRHATADASQEPEIQARLSEYYGLYYLIRAMAGTERSGILELRRGNRKGEVRFCDGAVISAQIGSLQGFPALHHLLLWEEAAVALKLRSVLRQGQFSLTADDLMDECERFLRDFAHAARDLGPPATVYLHHAAPPGTATSETTIPQEAGPVVRLFDGKRTLSEVIEESPFRVFDTLRIIKRLLDMGTLTAKGGTVVAAGGSRPILEPWLHRETAASTAPEPAAKGAKAPSPVRRQTPARLSSVPDQRGAVTNRRKSSSSQRALAFRPEGGARPTSPTSAPIPLTVKKDPAADIETPPPVVTTAAPIVPRRPLGTPKAPPAAVIARVMSPVDATGSGPPAPQPLAPLDGSAPITAQQSRQQPRHSHPQPLPQTSPPPAQARKVPPSMQSPPVSTPPPQALAATPAPRSDAKIKHKKADGRHLTPTSAFNALEADFFAREADLYDQTVETFDDLEHGTDPNLKIRPPGPQRAARKKK